MDGFCIRCRQTVGPGVGDLCPACEEELKANNPTTWVGVLSRIYEGVGWDNSKIILTQEQFERLLSQICPRVHFTKEDSVRIAARVGGSLEQQRLLTNALMESRQTVWNHAGGVESRRSL